MVILEPVIFPKHQADFSRAYEREHRLSPPAAPSPANMLPFSPRASHFGCDLQDLCFYPKSFTKQCKCHKTVLALTQ